MQIRGGSGDKDLVGGSGVHVYHFSGGKRVVGTTGLPKSTLTKNSVLWIAGIYQQVNLF